MKRLALLFPGQGTQYVGMGKDFFDSFKEAREVFEEADDLLSFKLSKEIFEDPEKTLSKTENCQPAIFVVSSALLKVFEKNFPHVKPYVCAGLSLGEYSALFAGKRVSFKDGLLLIKKRGELMSGCCLKKRGTMAAVLGLSSPDVKQTIEPLDEVWAANFNTPGQVVISGSLIGVERAAAALKERGAKRVIPLEVEGAFHSPFMEEARDGLKEIVDRLKFEKSSTPLVMNAIGNFVRDESEIRRLLVLQLTSSVLWEEGIRAMMKEGVELFLEIGPSKTLSAMNRKIGVDAGGIFSLEKVSDLDNFFKEKICF